MPSREEQVAQVEAVLRQRFFPLVPQDGPDGWSSEQHDANRLTRSLAAYSIARLCGLDDAAAAECITDGGDDGGIDAAHYDRANNQLVLVQSKFKRNGTAPSQQETLATVNGVKALREKRFTQFNARFQGRIDEIEEALDTAGVGITIVMAHLGDALGSHATADLNAYAAEANTVAEVVRWKDCGLAVVHGWITDQHAPGNVTINVTLELWKCVTTPRKAVYGQITAASLAALAERHGTKLFQRNIRHYLGTHGVNAAIVGTVQATPGDLFYLNNGITIVAEEIRPGGGTETRCAFDFVNASIVNGAQTAGAMLTASQNGTISADARLLVTVIEIGQNADELGVRITRARNHQNIVRGIDFAALDPTQERLRRELAAAGYRYFYRPSEEARIPNPQSITVEEAAVALACLSYVPLTRAEVDIRRARGQTYRNAIDLVVAAKKEVSRLWDQSGPLYPQLFSADLTGVRVCRLVRVFRMLNAILDGSERVEAAYARRMFFRHGRLFIMAFVGQRCAAVVNRAGHDLTDADRAELSRATNEIAEAIYAESMDRQWEKGYLAIFRNLGDAQPLADRVIRRLTAPPAPAAPAAPTPATAVGVPPGVTPGIVPPATGAAPDAPGDAPATDGPTTPRTDEPRGPVT
ncbi:MAG: putative abortive infection phage resistance protein [Phycisphaerae bacterium]|nr:MAG: putative abortive infection phage resistance protein [Phycisphaerae bacterium]